MHWDNLKHYLDAKSVSWWAGVGLMACAVILAIHAAHPLGWGVEALANLIGTRASPAELFLLGLGYIGIRAKLGKMHEEMKE